MSEHAPLFVCCQRIIFLMNGMVAAALIALIIQGIFKTKWKVCTCALLRRPVQLHAPQNSFHTGLHCMQHDNYRWLNNQFSIWSVALASICLVILWGTLGLALSRVRAACKSRKHW